jgi:Ca2+/Na+ antiporter
MNGGYLLVVGIAFGLLLILSQRIVPRHKRMFRGFLVFMAIFLMIRYEYQLETLLGYVFAIFLSFLFWLLIGRYNPVNDKDEIKVYGLND